MTRHLVMTAAVDITLPDELDDITPQQLAALALGVTVEWSNYPEGSTIRSAGPRLGSGSRRHNGSNPDAGWVS